MTQDRGTIINEDMQYTQSRNTALRLSLKAYLIHQTECWRGSLSCFSHLLLEARTSTRQKQRDAITNMGNDGTLHTSYVQH